MRDRVVVTAIILFDEKICTEIYKSLRYSTHIKLLIIKKKDQQFLSDYRCSILDIDDNTDSSFICNVKRLLIKNCVELLFIASFKVNHEIISLANYIDIKIANGSFFNNYDTKCRSNLISMIPNRYKMKKIDESNNVKSALMNLIMASSQKCKIQYPFLDYVNAKKNIIIDCFNDRHGKQIFISSVCYFSSSLESTFYISIEELDDSIIELANVLGRQFSLRGAWSFNIDSKDLIENKLCEVLILHSHCGWIIHRARGINLPLLCIQDFLDRDIQIFPLVDSNYFMWSSVNELFIDIEYSVILVDLDETIILDGKKVPMIMEYLLSSKDDNKVIILVTRHKNNITKTLTELSINIELFDKILHVREGENKSDKIKAEVNYFSSKMIFIDNEFAERKDVSINCNIPVFDVNGVDFLL